MAHPDLLTICCYEIEPGKFCGKPPTCWQGPTANPDDREMGFCTDEHFRAWFQEEIIGKLVIETTESEPAC